VRDVHADRFALQEGDFVIVSKAKPFALGDTEGHPFRGNQYSGGEHVEVEGRSIKVTHSARAKRAGDVLVPVDMAKFDAAWKQDTGFHIDPSGTGAIHGRLERIADFLKTSPQMDAAEVNVDADGRVGFTNGRHRMAYLRDKGVTRVPVSMTKESRANAKKHGLIAGRTDLAIINLPDISDVSFPSMVGAIPSKPPKRKRKRTLYKGVSLSRRPMKFEAKVLSLTEIPRRLDACRDTLLSCDEDRWRDTLHDLAAYGASEVLMELVRQGAPARLGTREIPVDVDGICAAVLADRARALTSLREDYEARLRRRRIRADRREALTQSFTDVRRPSLLKRFANRATNEAFALGRTTAMHLLQRQRIPVEFELAYHGEDGKFISKAEAVAGGEAIVDAVIQTAVMDTGTCDECAEVDGESMELGSDRQEELRPPYVKCLGGDACRCVQIALLSDGSEIDVDEIDEDTLGDHESDKPSKPSTKAAPEADTADTGDESDSED